MNPRKIPRIITITARKNSYTFILNASQRFYLLQTSSFVNSNKMTNLRTSLNAVNAKIAEICERPIDSNFIFIKRDKALNYLDSQDYVETHEFKIGISEMVPFAELDQKQITSIPIVTSLGLYEFKFNNGFYEFKCENKFISADIKNHLKNNAIPYSYDNNLFKLPVSALNKIPDNMWIQSKNEQKLFPEPYVTVSDRMSINCLTTNNTVDTVDTVSGKRKAENVIEQEPDNKKQTNNLYPRIIEVSNRFTPNRVIFTFILDPTGSFYLLKNESKETTKPALYKHKKSLEKLLSFSLSGEENFFQYDQRVNYIKIRRDKLIEFSNREYTTHKCTQKDFKRINNNNIPEIIYIFYKENLDFKYDRKSNSYIRIEEGIDLTRISNLDSFSRYHSIGLEIKSLSSTQIEISIKRENYNALEAKDLSCLSLRDDQLPEMDNVMQAIVENPLDHNFHFFSTSTSRTPITGDVIGPYISQKPSQM